ncbi:UDP-glucose 4-epimerase GalE [soil metagenome]
MRVLVTGGAGYIGSVAVERLLEAGHDVSVLDSLTKGHADAVPDGVRLFDTDLRDATAVRQTVQSAKPDATMHFGAVTVVPDSVRDPGAYYAVNTSGTNNLLQAMVATGVGRIVLSSTAAVYGSPETALVHEDDPLRPISPYGSSKLMAERIVEDFAAAHGIEFAVFRYFNVAGATGSRGENHDPETHLVPSAILAALGRREPLTLFGRDYPTPDGTAVRDYVHVLDLVDAHILALESPSRLNTAFNLGAGTGRSVAEIVAGVEAVSGRPVPLIEGPRREGDPAMLVADCSKAAAVLSWRPQHSELHEILGSAWNWFQRQSAGVSSHS